MTTLPTTLPAFLWHFARKQKWKFAVLMSATSAHVLESNVMPYALKRIVDTVSQVAPAESAYAALAVPALLFLGAFVALISVWRLQEWVYTSAMPRLRADIRMELFAYTESHSHAYFSNHFAGSIASKIGDLARTAHSLLDTIRWRFMSVFWVSGLAIFWLGSVSVYLSLLIAVWLVLHVGFSYAIARRITNYSEIHAEDENTLRGQIIDVLTNFATVRLFSRQRFEVGYIGRYQEIERASSQRTNVAILKSRVVIDVLQVLLYAGMLLLLAAGWKAGTIGAGDIVFVMMTMFNVIWLAWMLGAELPQFFSEVGVARQALTLINRAHGLVDVPGALPLRVNKGEVAFENVSFHYIPGRDIFRGKNITIQAGEKVGLVGFSGSGKSTFVNLILRLYDVEAGRIIIDGQDIAKVTQESLRASVAMIPQDTTLFHRTLMENIRYGRVEASDEEVIAASKQAHCHDFILETEHGYDSLVGERGVKLSGGQRQRIAIARAILKNAPILILDEATSSLDSITEKYIQRGFATLMQGRTTIVVAHRLSTLAHLDRILVFKDGQIIEDGSHRALLERGEHYAMLWNMQAGGFLPDEKI